MRNDYFFRVSVAKNTVFLTGASIIQKALSFVYFLVLARAFGADQIGKYTYALAFTTIFAIVVDGGLTPVLIRRIAQGAERPLAILRRVLKIKILLLGCCVALMIIGVFLLERAFEIRVLIIAAAAVMVIDSINLTLFGVLRGLHNLTFESAGLILAQLISFGVGLFVAHEHLPIVFALVGLGFGSLVHLCIALTGVKRLVRAYTPALEAPDSSLALGEKRATTAEIVRAAVPFALAGIFARGYSFLDSILLGAASFTATGIYSVPNKLTFAFQFIPLSLSASLYPSFSKTVHVDPAETAERFRKSERYLLATVTLIVALLITLRQKFLSFYGNEFIVAEITLVILSFALIFSFIAFPVGALLNAAGLQKLQTIAMGITLAVNAAMNVILIPHFGPIGAAISALVGNTLLFGCGVWFVEHRVLRLPWKELIFDFVWLMGVGCVLLLLGTALSFLHVYWLIVAALLCGAHIALLQISGIIQISDVRGVLQQLKKI